MGGGGVIRLVAGRCFGVGLEGSDMSTVVVWPRGSKLVAIDGGLRIKVPHAGSFGVGDQVEFGVTFGKERDVSNLALPKDCRATNAVVVEDPHLVNRLQD